MNEQQSSSGARMLGRAAAIVSAAILFLWPAWWNGFPLLYPDSLGYLLAGHGIVKKIIGIYVPIPLYASERSEIFSIILAPLHHGATLAPIVAAFAMLTSWTLWLIVRTLCPRRPSAVFLSISVVLAIFSSLPWYVSFVMPDILGPLLVLALFLLVFAPEQLRRGEEVALALLAVCCLGSHAANFLLASISCVVLVLLFIARAPALRLRGRRLVVVFALLAITAVAQIGIHGRLYGRLSLFGHAPPFLIARLLADGPARVYLKGHCSALPWFLCNYAGNLPTTDHAFLWDPGNIWHSLNWYQQEQLRRDQWPLAVATIRTYPAQQIAISSHNFAQSLFTLGPNDFWSSPVFTPAGLDAALPGLSERYTLTRQARNAMPQSLTWRSQCVLIPASLLLILGLVPWLWRTRNHSLLALTGMILFLLPANAFLSGVISGPYARYADRMIWLLPMLAGLVLAAWWDRPQASAARKLSTG